MKSVESAGTGVFARLAMMRGGPQTGSGERMMTDLPLTCIWCQVPSASSERANS